MCNNINLLALRIESNKFPHLWNVLRAVFGNLLHRRKRTKRNGWVRCAAEGGKDTRRKIQPEFPQLEKQTQQKKTTKHMAFKHNTNSETKAEQNERKLKLS